MEDLSKIFFTGDLPELDRYTIENEPVKSIDLMERAARAVADRVLVKYAGTGLFYVLAGRGNNGGDGYAVARMLRQAGRGVVVYDVAVSEAFSPDCAENRRRFTDAGGEVLRVDAGGDFLFSGEPGVWVDALFGAGLNRPVAGWVGEVIGQLNATGWPVVAVDMPSGLLGEDNRQNDGAIVRATWTLTFQFPKLALFFPENECYVGRFEVLEIGLHARILCGHPSPYRYLTREAVARRLPRWSRFAHKGTLGHALLVAGSYGMPGAALLALRGALRSGAGLVTAHVPRGLKPLLHLAAPEALVAADRDENLFTGITGPERYSAIGVGPGLGTAPETAAGFRRLLDSWQGPLVADADALNILAAFPEWLTLLPAGTILTPHPGEFARLAGKTDGDFDRLNNLTTFARRYGVVVVLKGAHTAIAFPDGTCCFNTTGNPGMAKGGSGDVLTGVITALLAGGMAPRDAAVVGVYVHGLAGDLAAARLGERTLTAGDLAEGLAAAWLLLEQERES